MGTQHFVVPSGPPPPTSSFVSFLYMLQDGTLNSHYQEDMGYQIIQKMAVINKMACRPILHSVGSVFF